MDRFRVLTHVLRQEASVSLGVAGRKLRLAIEALRQFDETGAQRGSPQRRQLLRNAGYALSAYVIQREALGLRDETTINNEFGVTPEIWHTMGITDPPDDQDC